MIFLIHAAVAQESRLEQDQFMMQQQGKLFTVNLSPKDRTLKVSFSGKPLVIIDPSKVTVIGHVFDGLGNKKELRLSQSPSSFQILEPLSEQKSLKLIVQDKKDPLKKEQFEFKIKP